ncbi:MAG: CpaF family protein [Candidatus Omnitrophica bacterium]|nr:CpaF family protein [Candidatus Omnitrophota bacterium]
MDEVRINLEENLLDRLKGKITLTQSVKTKEKIILNAFLEFCNVLENQKCEEREKYLKDENSKTAFATGFQSYGIIDSLLDDPNVEDIIINGAEPIYVHHSLEGLKETGKQFANARELDLLIKKILTFAGKENLKKINNIDLPGMRGRVNIIYSPLGPELTITKMKSRPLSIIDLIEKGTLNTEIAAHLWLYIEGMGVKLANILISGGPGSGKTTLLNALLSFVPNAQHIVVIEDSLELVTNWIGNVSRLESDEDLSLADLVKNSLRMRPDRIIVGEVRGSEAEDMITAMNIGKYCMATIHASTVRETIFRLQSNPMNIPETLINLVDVFIVMRKMVVGHQIFRVVDEIAESAGLEQKVVLISPLWKYDSAAQVINHLSPTTVYRDRLSRASGLNGKNIFDEINQRKDFLEMLRQADVHLIQDVSHYCESYIQDPEIALRQVSTLKEKSS